MGALSEENRERHLALLRDHIEAARYLAVTLAAFGESQRFDDTVDAARTEDRAIFEAARETVARYFARVGGPAPDG
jgi:hypothetical protein